MAVFRTDADTRRPRRQEWQQRNQYTEELQIVREQERRKTYHRVSRGAAEKAESSVCKKSHRLR